MSEDGRRERIKNLDGGPSIPAPHNCDPFPDSFWEGIDPVLLENYVVETNRALAKSDGRTYLTEGQCGFLRKAGGSVVNVYINEIEERSAGYFFQN